MDTSRLMKLQVSQIVLFNNYKINTIRRQIKNWIWRSKESYWSILKKLLNVKLDARNIEYIETEKVTGMKCISRMKYSEYNINHLKRTRGEKNLKLAYDALNIIPA